MWHMHACMLADMLAATNFVPDAKYRWCPIMQLVFTMWDRMLLSIEAKHS